MDLIFPFQNEIISPFIPDLIIKNTSKSSDEAPWGKFPFALMPDCSVYENTNEMKNKKETYLNFSYVDFIVELKREPRLDPFSDKPDGGTSNYTCADGSALSTLGQLTAYASSILSAQYRTHTFMVFIVKDYARLIRWDRSGAIFTKPIYFDNDPLLIDFFDRYNFADREARGHDITVSPASSQDIKLAKNKVPELREAKWCLDVTLSDQHFIIPVPTSTPDIPVGRWTRATFAYDTARKRRVFLKDSWRVLLDDVKPEGDIYQLLHREGVPNIPSCWSDGDVGDETYHRSQTDNVVDDEKFGLRGQRERWKLTPHRHYRIVLCTVGRKLEDFSCSREFVQAMYAALEGKMGFS